MEALNVVTCELVKCKLYMLLELYFFKYYTLKLCTDYDIVQLRTLSNINRINLMKQLK